MSRPVRIMLRVFGVLTLLALGAFIFLYVWLKADEKGRLVPWGENVDIAVLPQFRTALTAGQNFYLMEGLPRLKDQFKAEKKAHETTKLHGFHFYREALKPTDTDTTALVNTLTADHSIYEWGGTKMCGGYHPDYALCWTDSSGNSYAALVCFGCHEIKLYGEADLQLYADLEDDTYESLKEMLSSYRHSADDQR